MSSQILRDNWHLIAALLICIAFLWLRQLGYQQGMKNSEFHYFELNGMPCYERTVLSAFGDSYSFDCDWSKAE